MKIKLLLIFLLIYTLFSYSNNRRYRLIITDNPATTIMIGWEQHSGNNPVVYYGTTDYGTTYGSYTSTKAVDRSVNHKGMENRFAKLTGLTPNTNYYFVINDSEGTSQRFWFKTAPAINTTMSFIAGGDSRNNRTPRQNANTLVSKIKPTAVFFGGDMTNNDSSTSWQEWFDDWQNTTASDGRMIPIIPARGNHEQSNDQIYNLFNTPTSDVYYKITFGTNLISMYTLNSEIAVGGNQTTWLTSEVENDNAIWKSAQYHTPTRPHVSSKSENNDQLANWAQLFYDNGFRLVCESDSHTVKTTWPVKPCSSGSGCEEEFVREDYAGTVYVGEGCWGAPLRSSDDTKVWTRDSGSFNQFKHICVSTTEIEVRTIQVNDPAGVGENSNNSVCELPSGIDVWNPTNGSLVTIPLFELADIELTNPNQTFYSDGTNLSINTNVTTGTSTIDYVEFFLDGSSIGSDNSAPFTMTHTFANGYHTLKAVVYDGLGLKSEDEFSFSVGDNIIVNSFSIINGNDDVEEYENDGEMYLNSSDLEMYNEEDGGRNNADYMKVGLRFQNVGIPKDAVVSNAYIQFTSEENDEALGIQIVGENEDSSTSFTLSNLSSRSFTSNIVSWKNIGGWTAGDSGADEQTPDISAIINEIVGRAGWSSGNALSLILYGNDSQEVDKRVAEPFESSNPAPVLHVSYTVGGGAIQTNSFTIIDGDDDVEEFQNTGADGSVAGELIFDSSDLEMFYDSWYETTVKVGLRFQNVTIPIGATITNAYVQFTADESDAAVSRDLSIEIAGEDEDNSANFTTTTDNLSDRILTTEIVSWDPDGWSSGDSGIDEQTPDLSDILNEIVSRTGWVSGNAMSFVLYGTNFSETSERVAESFEGGAPAVLHVTYEISGGTLGVDDFHKNKIEIEVYPNPFNNAFTITLPQEYQNKAFVEIYTLLGQRVYYEKVSNKSFYLSNLESGLYIIKITDENGLFLASKRVVKE